MAAGTEIELKFLFAEQDLSSVMALVSAAPGARTESPRRLRTIYFDTPQHDLWNQGFTLRVRSTGQSYRQCIKRITSSSVQRDEWEEDISGPELDLERIKFSPLARLAGISSIAGALRPVFEVDADRASFSLETAGGLIEASIDCGSIRANGAELGVRELELELRSGAASSLFKLARALVSQAPLHPNPISKAERGHRLAEGTWGGAAKSSQPRLGADMTRRRAFQEICRTCLHDFHLNVPLMGKFDDVDGVHQGRVAIRRLRAALTLFKPMVFDISYRWLSGELKWLAGLLGAARDLDVLQASLRQLLSESEASEHARHFEARRLRARHAIVEGVNSERGRTLLLEFLAWIEDGRWQWQPPPVAEEPVQKFARTQLKKRLGKLVKRGQDLAELDASARHAIRIEAKKLRYMAEFFVAVRGVAKKNERFKAMIDCCAKLQEALGAIRDKEATAEFVRNEFCAGTGPVAGAGTTAAPPGQLLPLQRGAARELQKAVRAYLKLATIKPF